LGPSIGKCYKNLKKNNKKGRPRLKLFELGGYCNQKEDGLHDDPEDCENFIICFADRTFRTKCAYGTLWNHITKECDFPEKGIYIQVDKIRIYVNFVYLK
jgi:hypothetical protein